MVVGGPVDLESSSGKSEANGSMETACEDTRYGNGAGTGTARKGEARSALPNPNSGGLGREDLDKFYIDPSREKGVFFEARAPGFHGGFV
jgi:hypothetical protein